MDKERIETVQGNDLFHRMLGSKLRVAQAANPTGSLAKHQEFLENTVLIGIDPGETTGFAWHFPFEGFAHEKFTAHLQQLNTSEVVPGANAVIQAIREVRRIQDPRGLNYNCQVVMENYKVYAWKSDDHKWAGLHTPQLIGALKYALHHEGIPYHLQMAQEAKVFATDDNLKAWGLYERGLKHARDAERHIIRYIFFGE